MRCKYFNTKILFNSYCFWIFSKFVKSNSGILQTLQQIAFVIKLSNDLFIKRILIDIDAVDYFLFNQKMSQRRVTKPKYRTHDQYDSSIIFEKSDNGKSGGHKLYQIFPMFFPQNFYIYSISDWQQVSTYISIQIFIQQISTLFLLCRSLVCEVWAAFAMKITWLFIDI